MNYVHIRQYDARRFILTQPLFDQIIYTERGKPYPVNIPRGFVTDLASIPRIFWSIWPPFGLHTRAAVIHDYLYATKAPKDFADHAFLQLLKEDGVPWLRRSLFYRAVKLGGNPKNSTLIIDEAYLNA